MRNVEESEENMKKNQEILKKMNMAEKEKKNEIPSGK